MTRQKGLALERWIAVVNVAERVVERDASEHHSLEARRADGDNTSHDTYRLGISPRPGDASKEMNSSAAQARTLFGELLSRKTP
jgi:hypothetical protein